MFSICAAVILLLFTFAVRLTVVDGPSMQNTLVAGDYLLVQELGYKYERGDIIVVQDPSAFGYTKPLVKRLIAVGGDTVDIDDHVELDPQTGEKEVCIHGKGERRNSLTNQHTFISTRKTTQKFQPTPSR